MIADPIFELNLFYESIIKLSEYLLFKPYTKEQWYRLYDLGKEYIYFMMGMLKDGYNLI